MIALIYLAGGNSKRFGSNKLIYSIEGKSMFLHLLERLDELCEQQDNYELFVVTQYKEIINTAKKMGIKSVFFKESAKGISYTIREGLLYAMEFAHKKGLSLEKAAFFVADQPYLTQKTAKDILDKANNSQKGIACASYANEAGNPVVFDKKYFGDLLNLSGDVGGRSILRENISDVLFVEVSEKAELEDIDKQL